MWAMYKMNSCFTWRPSAADYLKVMYLCYGFQSNRAGNLIFQFQLSHKDIHTNKFAFCLCFLILHWSLQGKMAKFRMFKSNCEVKDFVDCLFRTLTWVPTLISSAIFCPTSCSVTKRLQNLVLHIVYTKSHSCSY